MTPRSQIHSLASTATLEEAALYYHRTGHTKIPAYGESRESIVGVLYARDLLREELDTGQPAQKSRTASELMREAFFVPETKSVADLFYTFRKRKLSLALTIDEYGGVTGLVTMEDLLECIFGEIMSRSELLRERALSMQEIGESAYRVDGAMTIQHFNRLMDSHLDSSSVETIGGLLLNAFGELPSKNSRIIVEGYEFAVDSEVTEGLPNVAAPASLPVAPAPGANPGGSPTKE
jgi:CBS domain containing-hemolysin-like protein